VNFGPGGFRRRRTERRQHVAKVRVPETVVVEMSRREFGVVCRGLELINNFGLVEDMDDAKALLVDLDETE
jgi:hypothetical protein